MSDQDNQAPKGTIHDDLAASMDQLEQSISTHVSNALFRDLALKGVEVVRKIVDTYVKV